MKTKIMEEEKKKIEKKYKKKKKKIFSWNGSYSNLKYFYTEEGKKN